MSESGESGGGGTRAIPARGWKFRFDSPPPGGLPWRVQSGDVLRLFQMWEGLNHPERRRSERYRPRETRAYLGWWVGRRFIVTNAEMINLSKGGALAEVDRRPPTSQPVWICLGTPTPAFHVQARTLDVSPENDPVRLVRLDFHVPCPEDFFRAAGRRDDPAGGGENPG